MIVVIPLGLIFLGGIALALNLGRSASDMARICTELPGWFVGPKGLVGNTVFWRVGGVGFAAFAALWIAEALHLVPA